MSFKDGNHDKPIERKTPVYIGRPRKDGKLPVKFIFQNRTIKKLYTLDQAHKELTSDYNIIENLTYIKF